jgi:molybdate transport system substrate-binding protein
MSASEQTLHLLCAGAAQGLVKALQGGFEATTGARVQGRFGAVGAMKEALEAGEPCDVMVVTQNMVAALVADGKLRAGSEIELGRVRTGIAVRTADVAPRVDSEEALRAALLAVDRIYFPDAERSTAGIHFAGVMRRLGAYDELRPRFATYPNGATAMRELAASTAASPLGCTQVTEINYTAGVRLVGVLPLQFELATVYAAAIGTRAAQPELARQFIEQFGGAASLDLRRAGGFEVDLA